MEDDLIITEENEDLFGNVRDDFNPPPILVGENILDKTPVIKFMTPVRKGKSRADYLNRRDKRDDEPRNGDEEEDDEFSPPEQISYSPIRSPMVDLTDNDEVNLHVRQLISHPGEIDYDKEPETIQELCHECFKTKFQSLIINYPEYKIEYPEGKSLNKIHKFYHELIKSIYVNMNISQYETYYAVGLLAIELIAVQVFNLPMAGYTKSELKRMYRYRALLIELGESFYPDGTGEASSIEWRLFSSMGWNIIIFLAVKMICSWVGGDEMSEIFRTVADQILNNPITRDNIESGEAKDIDAGNSNLLGDLLGGGGDLKDILSGLGSMFNSNTENNRKKGKRDGRRQRVVWGA